MSSVERRITGKYDQFKIYLLWGIALTLAVYFCYFVILNADSTNHGFSSYYTASKLLSKGEDVSRFYDNDWFSSKVKNYVPEVYEIYHVNLPTTTLIFLPLSRFDYAPAKIIWTSFNLCIFVITIGFLIKAFKKIHLPLIIIIILSFQPLYANFLFGQAYVFIFCLLVLAWYAYNTDRDGLLGFTIGIIFIIKSTLFVFFILLLIQKKWRSFLWAVLTALFVAMSSLPWIGIEAYYTYIEKLINYISHPSLSVTAYQTIHSFFHHLTIYNSQWNPTPIINMPVLGKTLSTLAIILILVFTSIKAYRLKKADIAFGIFVLAGLLVSPASLDYHFTIVLIPIIIIIRGIIINKSVFDRLIFIISIILIAAYIPYTSTKVNAGWLAVLAYPKLYGVTILWAIFMLASNQGKNESP